MPPGGMGAPAPPMPDMGMPQQQGMGLIPLAQMMPHADPAQGLPVPGGPHVDMKDVIKPANDQPEGLPAHRLQQMYTAWATAKQAELVAQLRYESFYHGFQWSEAEKRVLADRNQPDTYFNELRKKIDSYVGIEQRLRRDPKAYPRTPKHDIDCDVVTAALRQTSDETKAQRVFSEGGRDYFVRGIGALFQGVMRNGKGELSIIKRQVPSLNFIYDPRSVEWDFSDAKFIGEWGWFDAEDAENLFIKLGRPDSAAKMASLKGATGSGSSGQIPGEWARIRSDWFAAHLSRVRLVHLYYKYRGEWWCAYFCGSIELYNAPSIYRDMETGDTYQPYNAVSCNVDPSGERYGVVKDLIPIQQAINARHSKLLWMLSVRQIIMEAGAVSDVEKARKEARKADGIIELRPTGKGDIAKRFEIRTMDAEIQGQGQLLESSLKMMQTYGPNTAILGKGEGIDNASGRAILARQNSGMTEMSPVFERLREWKIESYRRDWRLIRQFKTDEWWLRVTDDEKGVKFYALNQVMVDPSTGRVVIMNDVAQMDIDITIEEGPDTVTMNEELMDIIAKAGNMPLPRLKTIIHLSGARNKDYLFKLLEEEMPRPDPEAAKQQDKMNMLELAEKAAGVDKIIAEVENKRADSLAKMAGTMAGPEVMQMFPFEYGSRSFVEDVLEQDLNPEAANAFRQSGIPGMPGMPMAPQMPDMMPMNEGGPSPNMPPMPTGPAPSLLGLAQPAVPGSEPATNQIGGLPLPGPQTVGGLQPPPGTRP